MLIMSQAILRDIFQFCWVRFHVLILVKYQTSCSGLLKLTIRIWYSWNGKLDKSDRLLSGCLGGSVVKHQTLAQAITSQLVSSSPVSGSVLPAQSLEPAWDSVSPSLSLSLPHCALLLSLKNKNLKNTFKKSDRPPDRRWGLDIHLYHYLDDGGAYTGQTSSPLTSGSVSMGSRSRTGTVTVIPTVAKLFHCRPFPPENNWLVHFAANHTDLLLTDSTV